MIVKQFQRITEHIQQFHIVSKGRQPVIKIDCISSIHQKPFAFRDQEISCFTINFIEFVNVQILIFHNVSIQLIGKK